VIFFCDVIELKQKFPLRKKKDFILPIETAPMSPVIKGGLSGFSPQVNDIGLHALP
jgi:hypothetical protein